MKNGRNCVSPPSASLCFDQRSFPLLRSSLSPEGLPEALQTAQLCQLAGAVVPSSIVAAMLKTNWESGGEGQRSLPGAGGPPEAVWAVPWPRAPPRPFSGNEWKSGRRNSVVLAFVSPANQAPHHRCRLFSAAWDISAHLHRRTARFKIGPRSLFRDSSTRLLETKKTRRRLFITSEGENRH